MIWMKISDYHFVPISTKAALQLRIYSSPAKEIWVIYYLSGLKKICHCTISNSYRFTTRHDA